MAKLKVCKDCGAEVSKSAKTCPNCGKKLKHTGLRVVLGIIICCVIIGALASGGDTNTSNPKDSGGNPNSSSSSTKKVTKENYDKIKKGMTKKEVEKILGEPMSVSESETPRSRYNGTKSLSRGIYIKSNRYILFRRKGLYEKLD